MKAPSDPLRAQLVRILDWQEAHVTFDEAVNGIPAAKRGARAKGLEHSPWELLEHIRIAQADILDFTVNRKYVHELKWPDDYWPPSPAPSSAKAWNASVAAYEADREKMKKVVRTTKDLFAKVPTGKDHHTCIRNVLLLADHTSYHVGQLIAVRRALGIWK